MRSPLAALTWEIWRRNARMVWALVGIVLFGWLFNLVLPASFHATEARREGLLTVNCFLMAGSLLLVLGTFNYTELNSQKEWTGFPYRLFTLPVPTWRLVALPMTLGIVAIELGYLAWIRLVFADLESAMRWWIAVLAGVYMVFYLTILWSLAGFRILRMVVLGIVGTSIVGVAFLPHLGKYAPSPWLSVKVLIPCLIGLGLVAFVVAWGTVGRQRRGGGRQHKWLRAWFDRVADVLPRRKKCFRSPAAAHFWYEWRRFGWLLPGSIAALLLLVVGPIAWHMWDESGSSLWILVCTLAMPLVLAFVFGGIFASPDFRLTDHSLPSFIAIRPLPSGEIVVAKMKVAALSAVISWLFVLVFLAAWIGLRAELALLAPVRVGLWMVYDHSVLPQYVITALGLVAAMFLTWKFLVGAMWVGLSGNRKRLVAVGVAYFMVPLLGLIGLTLLVNHAEMFRAWIRANPNRVLSYLEWIVAFAVIAKFWLAAISWRDITPKRVRRYAAMWLCGTLILVVSAVLLSAHGALSLALMAMLDLLPLDVDRLRNLLILAALLVIPLARLGMAPSALAKNRHR